MSNLEEQRKAYDALPLLDSEYNHPVVQNAVLNLIEAEMKAFAPPKDNYLSSLPYPKLRFSNAPGFAQEYEKINKENKNKHVSMLLSCSTALCIVAKFSRRKITSGETRRYA